MRLTCLLGSVVGYSSRFIKNSAAFPPRPRTAGDDIRVDSISKGIIDRVCDDAESHTISIIAVDDNHLF